MYHAHLQNLILLNLPNVMIICCLSITSVYFVFQYIANDRNLTATVIRALTIANDVDAVS